MPPPAVFVAHGFWGAHPHWQPMFALLQAAGYETQLGTSVHLGTRTAPGSPTIADTIAKMHEELEALVERKGDAGVIVLCHSAGGIYGSAAVEGLGWEARRKAGEKGGVTTLLLVSCLIMPEGVPIKDRVDKYRKMDVDALVSAGGARYEHDATQVVLTSPEKFMFNDLPAAEAAHWSAFLLPEPNPYVSSNVEVRYMGWREVPSVYVVCEHDNMIPQPFQDEFAALAGSTALYIPTSHMPHVSRPDLLVDVVKTIAAGELP